MLQVLFCIFLSVGFATSPAQKDWLKWKEKNYKKALSSPTSFLNATSLKQSPAGKSLYLVLNKNRKMTAWVKDKPKDFYAQAEHLGEKIRIQIKGKTLQYLSIEPKKRRKKITLPNGAIAEVVYGKRVKKMWTYIYDPDQIKTFSGFRFYPFNEKAITEGIFKLQKPRFVTYKTVQGDQTKVSQIGNVSFMLHGKEFFLPAYNWQERSEKIKYIALVFTDSASGKETYSGGRELVIELPDGLENGQRLEIDFNRTMNFYCVHSPYWHCPVGLQKTMNVKVAAGEKLPLKKIVK